MNKFKIKHLFNLIFIIGIMFIYCGKASAITVKEVENGSFQMQFGAHLYKWPLQVDENNNLVYSVNVEEDDESPKTCTLTEEWNRTQRLAIATLIKRAAADGAHNIQMTDYYFAATAAINAYVGSINPSEKVYFTCDTVVCELTRTYYSLLQDYTAPSVESLTVDTTNLTFTKSGDNYVSNPFTLSHSVSSSEISVTPSNAELKEVGTNSYRIEIPISAITADTNIIVTVSKTFTSDYARKYTCGSYQPVARLETETSNSSVTLTGKIDGPVLGKIVIKKVDSENTSTELSGGKFRLYKGVDCKGTVISVNDSNPFVINGTITISNLYVDETYSVEEVEAPSGYKLPTNTCVIASVKPSESEDPTAIVLENTKEDPPTVSIIKVDSVTTKGISGAKFHIEDSTGKTVINQWTSNGSWQSFELEYGTYYLVEDEAPAGYIRSQERKEFTLSKEKNTAMLTMKNTPKPSLKILKVDEKGNPLLGAKLQLLDSNKTTVIEEWLTDGKEHLITKTDVVAGKKYYVKEISAPEGYLINEELLEVVLQTGETKTVKFENTKNKVLIKKVDADDKTKNVVGATLHIEDSNGKKIGESWVTDGTSFSIETLEPGTYYLVEEKAPEGYIRNTSKVEFKVTGNETKVITVEMTNKKSEVEISKIDATTKKELAGAKLKLTDEDGNVIEEWISTDKPYVIKGLKDGKYILSETIAPAGYTLSNKTVEFEVKNGKVDKPVVMINELTQVPSTGSSRSTLLLCIAMLDIALGIGIITYVRKNRLQN